MSIRSQMRNRAADMAQAMADRARTPQEISAAQQRIAGMVQSEQLPPYIGIPIIDGLNKQLAQARQAMAQGAMGPQAPAGGPPVAQQVMAQAQAAQPGVAALPSQLPAEYAHGGIVAFEDGGEVERYQTGGMPIPNRTAATPVGRAWDAFTGLTDEDKERVALQQQLKDLYQMKASMVGGFMSQSPEERQRAQDAMEAVRSGDISKMRTFLTPIAATPDAKPVAETKTVTATADGTGIKPEGAGVAGLGFKLPAYQDVPEFKAPTGKSNAEIVQEQINRYRADTEKTEAEAQRRIDEAKGKITGKAFEGLEADLRKEAEELGADKEQAKYMAMFKAGLAMMSGTSRHALENIGKGAMVGAEDYQKAAKDIKLAERENRRMKAQIEQARRAESIGDRDAEIAATKAWQDRKDRGVQFMTNALITGGVADRNEAMDIAKTTFAAQARRGDVVAHGQFAAAAAEGRRGSAQESLDFRARVAVEKAFPSDELSIKTARDNFAKAMGLSKPPEPGKDAKFDKNFNAYRNDQRRKLYNEYRSAGLYGLAGGPDTPNNPYSGYSVEQVRPQ